MDKKPIIFAIILLAVLCCMIFWDGISDAKSMKDNKPDQSPENVGLAFADVFRDRR